MAFNSSLYNTPHKGNLERYSKIQLHYELAYLKTRTREVESKIAALESEPQKPTRTRKTCVFTSDTGNKCNGQAQYRSGLCRRHERQRLDKLATFVGAEEVGVKLEGPELKEDDNGGSGLATFVRGEEVGANKEGNPDMEEDDYDGGRTDAFDLESEYFVQQSAFFMDTVAEDLNCSSIIEGVGILKGKDSEDENITKSGKEQEKKFLEQMRENLLNDHDGWICIPCGGIEVASLVNSCHSCHRLIPFVPLELDEFRIFVTRQRENNNIIFFA